MESVNLRYDSIYHTSGGKESSTDNSGDERIQVVNNVDVKIHSETQATGIPETDGSGIRAKRCRSINPDHPTMLSPPTKVSKLEKEYGIESAVGSTVPEQDFYNDVRDTKPIPDLLNKLKEACQNRFMINKERADFDYLPPLHFAIKLRQYELIPLALSNGAKSELRCIEGYAPLHHIAESGDEKMLDILHQTVPSIDMNQPASNGETPLMVAAANGNNACAASMISYGASINTLDHNGNNILFFALKWRSGLVDFDEPPEFVHMLIRDMDLESLASQETNEGWTVLHMAAENNEFEVVEGLIDREINVNVRSESGSLPLMLAVEEDAWHSVVMLVDAGSEGINELLENDELTPLTKAVLKGERDTLEAMAASRNLDLDKDIGNGKTHRQLLDECCRELSKNQEGLEQQSLTVKEVYKILEIDDSE
ncbi:ankyrin repeat domain-containing protein [Endozoicomonas atrinae]|uniref:ankyrin repeat domain-containing protein n=1 Tax=Endozoicomonas atrinae TaxID=1333660 RepID=UPI003B0064A0